jgi:PBP1b-binding outer membrane lipoprotein LpoB
MKNKLGLLVAIIGLAFFVACENEAASDQTQQEQTQKTEQVQKVTPAMDSVAVDSMK